MATVIQIGGAALLVIGIGLISIPASLIVAGLAAITFGIALERK
jgi:uncharacterized membrane-anchored protein YitT (DUF2179 family)